MIKNYLKVAFRNIYRNKIYSFINIFGLAVGMACSILILLWVQEELSYDDFHENGDEIYQAYLKSTKDDQINFQSTTSPAIAGILKNEYPEIIETVRLGDLDEIVFKYENKILLEKQGKAADPEIFKVFSFPLAKGDEATALTQPFSIVLTQDYAKKYFGNEDPIGKMVKINNAFDLKVTGVLKNLPHNSYQEFDFLVPFTFLKELGKDIQGTPFYPCSYLTYSLLQENTSATELNAKVKERLFSEGKEITFEIYLIPLTETYLLDTGGMQRLYVFSLIAIIILIIASINFMNLATAKSFNRSKEIGMRKVAGAQRGQIIKQFLGESFLLTLIALIFAIIIGEILLPYFNEYAGSRIVINLFDFNFISSLIGVVLVTSIIAGMYPAIFLSSFNPVSLFKDRMKSGSKKTLLRKSLVILQFSLSIFFIICTIIISNQINYVQNFNLGLNKDNIVYVRLDGEVQNKFNLVKNELIKNPNIYSVCSSSNLPNVIRSGSYFQWGVNDEHTRRMCYTYVSYDYLKTFDIEMADGRFYSRDFSTDSEEAIIVNETAIKKVALETPVNKPFYFGDMNKNLIGVVKDFQHNSVLNTPPEPLALFLRPEGNQYLFAKINPEITDIHILTSTVNHIKSVCNRFSPDRPLQYNFLNEYTYDRERVIEVSHTLIFYSTFLAILISALGLFGLSSFMIEGRTKEIGIRKALGSSISNILMLISKEYVKWVIIAGIVACPLAWYTMNQWLQGFAHQVQIGYWVFFIAAGIAMSISLITISTQSVKAAIANPIESLRCE
jgi:putative ABC transport system permease protein